MENHTTITTNQITPPPLLDPHDWPVRTGLDNETLQAAIETIIYLSDSPIGLEKIRSKIDLDMPLEDVLAGVNNLQKTYEAKVHGLRLAEVGGGYQLRTRPMYAMYARQMVKTQTLNIGTTALEVLAIIAYKGPISRHDIDQIRGVDSSHILRGLIDKKLVSLHSKNHQIQTTDSSPHPSYATTQYFLEFFGLNSLDDLPPEHEIESLIAQSEVGVIKDIKELVSEHKAEDLDKAELEDLDKLSQSIRETVTETDFVKALKTPAAEGEKSQNAFDLLETFTIREEIIHQNTLASQSLYEYLDTLNNV